MFKTPYCLCLAATRVSRVFHALFTHATVRPTSCMVVCRITATRGGCWFAVGGRERGAFRRGVSFFRCERHATRVAGAARGDAEVLLCWCFVLVRRVQRENEDLSMGLGNHAQLRHTAYYSVPKY